jgi:hypothetical protein
MPAGDPPDTRTDAVGRLAQLMEQLTPCLLIIGSRLASPCRHHSLGANYRWYPARRSRGKEKSSAAAAEMMKVDLLGIV